MSELIQRMPAVVQTIRLSDLVDIAILSIVIYKLLWMVRKTSSGRVLRGIMIVVVAIWASAEFNLYATSFVLNRVVEYAILVLVILFQPEIRRFLERVGSSRMSKVSSAPGGRPRHRQRHLPDCGGLYLPVQGQGGGADGL